MSKIKAKLEEDMMRYPELYNGEADYEFWVQCRKEKLLEKEGMKNKTSQTEGKKNEVQKIPTR